MQVRGEHRSAEGDAIRDVGCQDDHVWRAVLSWVMTPAQSGTVEVVRHLGDDGGPRGQAGPGRCVGDRASVVVGGGDDRDPKLRRRLGQSRRQLGCRERRRVGTEVGSGGADAEDERKAPAGQLVGDRSGFPVHQSRVAGSLAGGDRQRRRIRPDDDRRAVRLELVHDRGGVGAWLQVLDVEDDPASVNAAVSVHEVRCRLDTGELLLRQACGIARRAGRRRRRGSRRRVCPWTDGDGAGGAQRHDDEHQGRRAGRRPDAIGWETCHLHVVA